MMLFTDFPGGWAEGFAKTVRESNGSGATLAENSQTWIQTDISLNTILNPVVTARVKTYKAAVGGQDKTVRTE